MLEEKVVTILFILPSLSGGGAEKVAGILLRRLDRTRFKPVVAVLSSKDQLQELSHDVCLIDLKAERARFAWLPVVRAVRRLRPDIVFSFLGYLNAVVILARPLAPRGIRFICRETNLPTLHNNNLPFPFLASFLYKVFYRFYDRLICQSEDMAGSLMRYARVGRERIAVINNPVDPGCPGADRRHGARDKKTYHILAAGKLTPQKGFDLLLEAFSSMTLKNVELTVLGQGPEERRLKHAAGRLGVAGRVHFEGFSRDIGKYMKEADLFVLSSRYEGFPNVLLEAGNCGLPVVAFACPGGIRDIIVEGVNGLTVGPGDVAGLAEAMSRGLRSDWDREKVRQSVLSRFSSDIVVPRYEALFDSLMSE
jgi:glycosyltransferase involved in cell wall biosynthesis